MHFDQKLCDKKSLKVFLFIKYWWNFLNRTLLAQKQFASSNFCITQIMMLTIFSYKTQWLQHNQLLFCERLLTNCIVLFFHPKKPIENNYLCVPINARPANAKCVFFNKRNRRLHNRLKMTTEKKHNLDKDFVTLQFL